MNRRKYVICELDNCLVNINASDLSMDYPDIDMQEKLTELYKKNYFITYVVNRTDENQVETEDWLYCNKLWFPRCYLIMRDKQTMNMTYPEFVHSIVVDIASEIALVISADMSVVNKCQELGIKCVQRFIDFSQVDEFNKL